MKGIHNTSCVCWLAAGDGRVWPRQRPCSVTHVAVLGGVAIVPPGGQPALEVDDWVHETGREQRQQVLSSRRPVLSSTCKQLACCVPAKQECCTQQPKHSSQ